MNILGVTHPISRNSAACILKEGKLIAFAEEERFNRIKHSPFIPANLSIKYCLEEANLTIDDLDFIAIGWDKFLNTASANIIDKINTLYSRTDYINLFSSHNREKNSIISTLKKYIIDYYQGLYRLPFSIEDKRIKFIRHHIAHAASSYYVSGFTKACIISADGGGGQEAGILAVGDNTNIEVIRTIPTYHSLGHLYGLVTRLLGFEFHDGEGKVMGLAAYGKKNAPILPFVSFKDGITIIDHKKENNYLMRLKKKLSKNPLEETSVNLAASLQKTIEQAYVYMAEYLFSKTGIKNFCLAGGVSLNCLANTRVLNRNFVENIFIQPASSDAGTALGAALKVYIDKKGSPPVWEFKHPYFGPQFSNTQILYTLKKSGIKFYKYFKDIEAVTAKLISQGNIIGWFQGRMEVGPRALGNRSILADPSDPKIKILINNRIKGREPWRPFAPSILEEFAPDYLVDMSHSPFMILESKVRKEKLKDIIAATHIDKTVRPHTVSRKSNRRYWKVIDEFRKLTGIPAILNTSFNLSGEPIVCTPMDAISTFYRCGLDYLVMGNFIISKFPFNK